MGRGRECIWGESVVAYQGGGEGRGRGRECIRGRACWPTRGRVCDRRVCLLIRGGWRERIGEESLMAHQGERRWVEGDSVSWERAWWLIKGEGSGEGESAQRGSVLAH